MLSNTHWEEKKMRFSCFIRRAPFFAGPQGKETKLQVNKEINFGADKL